MSGYIGSKTQIAVTDSYTKAQSEDTFAPITRSRKNKIINGNFDIWQRGISFNFSNEESYTADRWVSNRNGSGQSVTISQEEFTLGQTDVPNNPKYFYRYSVGTAGSGETFHFIGQRVEDVRTFSGKTISISLYMKSPSPETLPSIVLTQRFGSGGSPSSSVITQVEDNIEITSSWKKYTFTVEVPSISGKVIGDNEDSDLQFAISLPLNSLITLDIAQVQLEEGDVATDFEQRPIGEELSLCQRYYFDSGSPNSVRHSIGSATTGGTFRFTTQLPTTMRASPSVSITAEAVSSNFDSPSVASVQEDSIMFSSVVNSSFDQVIQNVGVRFTADAEL